MAKRYIISESQYRFILNKTQLNENPLMSMDNYGQDSPGYALTNIALEDSGGEQMLGFYWEEEGTGRVYKGLLSADDLQERGVDANEVISAFQSAGGLPPELEGLETEAWDTAEYLHDGKDESEYYGN